MRAPRPLPIAPARLTVEANAKRVRRSGPRSPRPASAVEPASAPPPSHRSRAMAISAREFRKEHARRAAQAVSTVLVRDIEQESAHEMAIRSALVPMGTVKEVNLMLLEGDRQSWALVTFANETSAQRSTSRAQRKGYGCTVAVRWSVRMVPAAEMLQLQMHFMPVSLADDGGRVQFMREAFDKGVAPKDLYKWRTSPESLAKAQHDESTGRLLEIEALHAGKTVEQIVAPSASDQARMAARRQQQAERRKKVLGYEAQVDEEDGGRGWGGDALNKLVATIGRENRVIKAWTVPPVPPSPEVLNAERERLKVAADRLRTLSKLKPQPPPPTPRKPKKRRLVLQLPNATQAPTWPRSTGMGSSSPRLVFDVPHRNPYKTEETDPHSSRGQVRGKWKAAIQSNLDTIAGWRREGDTVVVADPAITQLLHLCGVTGSVSSGSGAGRKSPPRAGSPGRKSPMESEEFRVKASLLLARTVFQKLVFYAADHPTLTPLLDSLRKADHHKVEAGPWITKLRERTAEIKLSCPDGRPSLQAARAGSPSTDDPSSPRYGDGVDSELSEPGLRDELPALNDKVDELLEEGEPEIALHMIDDWLERHHDAGGHPPERHPSTGQEVHLLTRRSQALVIMGEDARSNLAAMKLIDIRPSNPRPHVLLAGAHIDRANHETGQYFRATECYLDAMTIAPAAVASTALRHSFTGVRLDRDYRNEILRPHHHFPTQDAIRTAMETVVIKADEKVEKVHVRKKYDWTKVDVSDLVIQQHRVRVGLLKMSEDDDGVTPSETKDLLRNMTAEQLPKQMINTVKAMCIDGEIDEDDKAVLQDLAPPDKLENLTDLQELLEQMEQKILAVFRHYCYLISAGSSGVNERSDAVSSAQFTMFVKDCKMLEGHHALNKSAVDQIFLRAMFLRGGSDGLGGKGERPTGSASGEQKKNPREREASLGAARTGSSSTIGSDGTQRALELYEFTGAMVRLANRRYPNMIGKGLTAKFDRFTDEVLDKMEAGGIHNLEELMESREIKKVLKDHLTKLTRIFEVFAKADTNKIGSVLGNKASKNIKSSASHTINMKEFEEFCEAGGLIQPSLKGLKFDPHGDDGPKVQPRTTRRDGTPFILTRHDPREVFVEVNLDDDLYDQEDADNEADEIVYDEFTECLVLLAQRQLVKKAAEVVIPPPKTFEPEEVAPELVDLLRGMFVELAQDRKDLRGIDRVRKEDASSDEDDEDPSSQAFQYASATAATQGRRAAGVSWTRLPWKRRPAVQLRPPSSHRDADRRNTSGSVSPSAARPITHRDLQLHTVPALVKLARNSNAVADGAVDEVMKDTTSQKAGLIKLLTEAAAANFRQSYIEEYGVPPPAEELTKVTKGSPGKKKKKKSAKKKK